MFRRPNLILVCLAALALFGCCRSGPDKAPPRPAVVQPVSGYEIQLRDKETRAVTATYHVAIGDVLEEDLLSQTIRFKANGTVIVHHGSWIKRQLH